MGDLISRSALMKKSFVLEGHRVVSYLDVIEEPTAYNSDAVVEELKSLSNAEADYYYANSNDVIDRETAIDIVKRGGVE